MFVNICILYLTHFKQDSVKQQIFICFAYHRKVDQLNTSKRAYSKLPFLHTDGCVYVCAVPNKDIFKIWRFVNSLACLSKYQHSMC